MSDAFIFSPATGQLISREKRDRPDDLHAAVAQARRAQPAWAATSVRTRAQAVRAMGRYLLEYRDDAARVVAECTGKPLMDALSTEVVPGIIAARYYARMARRILRSEHPRRSSLMFFNKTVRIDREPYGVVGIISPWNYPLGIPLHELFTALLCGNAVVLKVATQVQPVGDLIGKMAGEAGVPEGLLSIVYLPGKVAGEVFIAGGIDKLFFTGSTPVGRELMARAAERLLPVSLELGGNDAMIVLDDADPYRAALGSLWAGVSNCGQSCGAVERIYVQAGIYDVFRKHLVAMIGAIREKSPSDPENELGFMTTEKQFATVQGQLRDAITWGARIAAVSGDETVDGITTRTGSVVSSDPVRSAGRHHPVVLLEEVPPESPLMAEETFGPLLALARFDTDEEAVAMANATIYGLTASVWSADRRRARALARRIEAGAVTINDHLMSHGMPETPWGGFKQSGIGRCHGREGFLEMTRPKVIVDDRLHRAAGTMWWPPYSRRSYEAIAAATDLLYGDSLYDRIQAIPRVVGHFLASLRRRVW